jgi:hypothetical protein
MKLVLLLTAVALVPASAQLGTMKQAPPASVAVKPSGAVIISEKPAVPLPTIGTLEAEMNARLGATGGADPCIVLGQTRGLYVAGLGAVFTAEVELAATPGMVGAFPGSAIGPEQKVKYHKSKLAHVPMLQQTMRDMVLSLAASPSLKLGDTEQIVVAVRLVYRPWEDITGLPGQIVMREDRRGGTVKMEIQ